VTSSVAQFLSGVRLLGRGLGLYARNPRLLLLGVVPALITGLLFLAGFTALLIFIDEIVRWATPFADTWSPDVRGSARVVTGVGIVGFAGLLGVLAFTAVTLLVGDPFYEKISERVDDRYGGAVPKATVPRWQAVGRDLADSARLLGASVLVGLPLFCAGLLPGVGQTVVPVAAAGVGGWFLAVELVGVPFNRRGLRLSHRRAMLRAHRPMALGFGVAAFVCFLVPLGAVLLMPAAVAGATLLARHVLGLSIED
jgi:CysZ protein